MLKFLQNKSSNRLTVKPLVKYQPQLIYGHTEQSPYHFVNRHTIYFNTTQQSNMIKKIEENQFRNVKDNERKALMKQFRQSSQQFNISSQYRRVESGEKSKNNKRQGNVQANGQFNISRGEFSNFLDKHKHYGSLGTIHKENQAGLSATQTQSMHKFNWNKSGHTESKSFQTKSKQILQGQRMSLPSQTIDADRSVLNNSKNSTMFGMTRSNSVSIFQKVAKKSQLKLRRDQFIGLMRKQAKDKLHKKYQSFGLPRIGVDHELFLLPKTRIHKNQDISEFEEMNSDINKFQQSLNYKFK